MGSRNYLARTLVLLALALAVGIAVAVTSGDERAHTVKHNSWFAIAHRIA
jgi:xanthine/uracil permease